CKDLEQIGEGGFGIVYSATFQGVKYALKSLRKILRLQGEDIKDFRRETPSGYSDIYKKCWLTKPDERPTMDEILGTLNKLSETTTDFNIENKIDKLSNLSVKLSKIYIDSANNGTESLQISKLIEETIVKHQETSERMFEYLNENQDSDNSCILGLFYHEGIGTREDREAAFNMLEKTANEISFNMLEKPANEIPIAKFYLGECFRCGYGTKKNLKSAVSWYEKAANDGHARSMNALGLCHIKGIGVKINKNKAIDCFNKAYEMNYIPSCNNLEIVISSGEEQKQIKKRHSNFILKLQPKTFPLVNTVLQNVTKKELKLKGGIKRLLIMGIVIPKNVI
ncbi:8334_t:CDS:2, partial [Dentiscutata erythropus]